MKRTRNIRVGMSWLMLLLLSGLAGCAGEGVNGSGDGSATAGDATLDGAGLDGLAGGDVAADSTGQQDVPPLADVTEGDDLTEPPDVGGMQDADSPPDTLVVPGDVAEQDAVPDVATPDVQDAGAADVPDVLADAAVDAGAPVPDVAVDEDAGEDAQIEEDAGPSVLPVDCDDIPSGPFELVKLKGPMASEDLAFDKVGNVVGSNDKTIFKSPYGGPPQVFVAQMNYRAGMRYLPNGHLIVCDNNKGQLVRVDETGTKHVLLTGLAYPNGITVDMGGWVYFTEHDANQVWRVHPFTGEKTLLTNKIKNPNGITFSPDYKHLYIDGFSGVGTIYAMSISEDGVPGKLISWATNVGTGWLDGMGVDACGNVYVADYGQTVIFRVSPDGQTKTKIAQGGNGAYLPNMQWGSGVGGWDPYSLYLPDGWVKGVFEMKVGVPSKERPYP